MACLDRRSRVDGEGWFFPSDISSLSRKLVQLLSTSLVLSNFRQSLPPFAVGERPDHDYLATEKLYWHTDSTIFPFSFLTSFIFTSRESYYYDETSAILLSGPNLHAQYSKIRSHITTINSRNLTSLSCFNADGSWQVWSSGYGNERWEKLPGVPRKCASSFWHQN